MADNENWGGGLFGCANNNGEGCCMCVLGFTCPAIVYGLNYNIAANKNKDDLLGCLLPCMVHECMDNCSWSLSSALHCGVTTAVPLGCLLRYNHRRAAVKLAKSNESSLASFCTEVWCWSCSVSQVNRQFRQSQHGNSMMTQSDNFVLGTVSVPDVANSFYEDDEHPSAPLFFDGCYKGEDHIRTLKNPR